MYTSFLIRSAILLLLTFSLAGCGKTDLSRSSAKDMIQGSTELKALTQKMQLNPDAGHIARLLDVLNSKGVLTPKGTQLFSKIEYGEATLVHPLNPPVIEVTGITSVPMSEDMKEVQFNLTFQYPPAIKRYAAKIRGGVAGFRRYDDGWRLEKVNISIASEPQPLTAQEERDVETEAKAVASERTKLKADLQKLVEESRIPKREILKFAAGDVVYRYASEQDMNSLILWDTQIYIDLLPGAWGTKGGSSVIWFGDIGTTPLGCVVQKLDRGWRGREHIYQDFYVWKFKHIRGAEFSYLFVKEAHCSEFNTKFYEAYQNWRNDYWGAISSLAELQ